MKDITSKILIGADPELFFKKDGKIFGSERVIPEDGIPVAKAVIVRDGVQLELHPKEAVSMSETINAIANAIKGLQDELRKHPGVSLCFDGVVKVEREELLSLSEKSRLLGCQPSENVYGLKTVKVDPMKYLYRSGGGHVHLGLPGSLIEYRAKHIPILDALLGIPCVLLDRDPAQKERRKVYGRVGEYRTPPYGVEYRTLSNFWLHSPYLAEFVLAQAKIAACVVFATVSGEQNLEKELLDKLDFRKMIRAVQTNSADLAWEVWRDTVRPFCIKNCTNGPYASYTFPISHLNVDRFELLANDVAKSGLAIFGANPLMNWETGQAYYSGTFQNFITSRY